MKSEQVCAHFAPLLQQELTKLGFGLGFFGCLVFFFNEWNTSPLRKIARDIPKNYSFFSFNSFNEEKPPEKEKRQMVYSNFSIFFFLFKKKTKHTWVFKIFKKK